jgi:hypothetical protein
MVKIRLETLISLIDLKELEKKQYIQLDFRIKEENNVIEKPISEKTSKLIDNNNNNKLVKNTNDFEKQSKNSFNGIVVNIKELTARKGKKHHFYKITDYHLLPKSKINKKSNKLVVTNLKRIDLSEKKYFKK